ncbi:TAXI family TRAP transporter solute-binding subunit [Haloarchaeobius salinus]|uniref:TAXI family TRAP transporter solute-binding subunit n=1 Tax=Haloarchaeobius salinus TaxID=1198298 RepID=UPI00210D00C6|nr:TAXI family TRAP transporter solute-binding subunit [Haloarchaeobius salinus]
MDQDIERRRVLRGAGLAGLAGLAGCLGNGNGGDGTDQPNGTETEDGNGDGTATETDDGGGTGETRLSWHAGGTGGTYFPLSNEFKQIVEANTEFTLQVQSTGASVENVGSLANGSADFALIQNDVAYFARNGESIDAFVGNAVETLRGVATLYPETITIVTLAGTGISQPADLEGATINTGDLGSGTQVNATQILEVLGIEEYDEQNAGFATAADQLRNGDIDAAFVVGGWPVGAIADLATSSDIEIVEITGDNLQAVLDAAPFYAEDTIPGGTYNGVGEDRGTVSVQAMIATRSDLAASTVESVTAAIFDNTGELSIKSEFITRETAQDGMSIELHEGAAAYFG